MFESISWVGVGAATTASMALGFLWFGPLFLRPWLRELGKTEAQMNSGQGAGLAIGIQVVASIVTAIVLAIIIERFGPGILTGMTVGLLCGAGLVATAKLADVIFAQTSSSKRFWIEAGHSVVSYALMGAVYGLFG